MRNHRWLIMFLGLVMCSGLSAGCALESGEPPSQSTSEALAAANAGDRAALALHWAPIHFQDASFGSFAGDKTGGCGSGTIGCDTNAANTPWGWDDSNDGPGRGALATDPAGLVTNYFNVPEGVNAQYSFNQYR